MAWIIRSPIDDGRIHPAYRPIVFYVQCDTFVVGSTIYGIKAKLNVYNLAGAIIKTIEVISRAETFDVPTVFPIFKFDFSRYLQDFLSFKFNEINLGGSVINGECAVRFDVAFANAFLDASGVLQIQTSDFAFATSGTLVAVNATRQHTEWVNYGANNHFTMRPFVHQGSNVNIRFLTNKPNIWHISKGQSESLSFLCDETQVNGYRVVFFASNGSAVGVGYKFITAPTFNGGTSINPHRTIGIGPNNIDNTVWSASTGLPGISNLVTHYEVVFGYINVIMIYGVPSYSINPFSEVRRFNLASSCVDDVRLHWVNLLGAIDSYTFDGSSIDYKLKSKSTDWQKGLGFKHSIQDYGLQPLNSSAEEAVKLFAKQDIDTLEKAKWISEIMTSPMVMIVQNGVYVPIKIIDGDNDLAPNEDGLIPFSVTFRFANSRISQRN